MEDEYEAEDALGSEESASTSDEEEREVADTGANEAGLRIVQSDPAAKRKLAERRVPDVRKRARRRHLEIEYEEERDDMRQQLQQ